MPIMPIHIIQEDISHEELLEVVAKLQKIVKYLTGGQLDFENIRVKGIVAENIDVNQLSAIAADLGHITAGLIEAVSIIGSVITGSLIQTSESSYPRAEMSSTATLFRVASDALKKLEVIASIVGYPSLTMTDGVGKFAAQYGPDTLSGINRMGMTSDDGYSFYAFDGDFDVITNLGAFRVNSWSRLVNRATGNSLQTDLNAKANAFTGATGSFVAGTQTVTVVNGIVTSIV